MKIPISTAIKAVIAVIKAKLVALIVGPPGCGKSDIVHKIAKDFNLKLIDIRLSQCDPTDLNGFPAIVGNKATYTPMDTFPLEGDPLPMGEDGIPMNGWLIFFDELTSAAPAVQAAAYKILLDRKIGNAMLHPNVAMVGAGNREEDNAIVEEMSTALQSRLVHLELEPTLEEWLEWAAENEIDFRITSYLQFKPNNYNSFRADHTDNTYACPRTWAFVNKLLKQVDPGDSLAIPLLSGAISEGVASEFVTFCRIYQDLPTISEILRNPLIITVPKEPSVLFALTGALAHNISRDNSAILMEYISRLPSEFQVVCVREIMRVNLDLRADPNIQKWVTKSALIMI